MCASIEAEDFRRFLGPLDMEFLYTVSVRLNASLICFQCSLRSWTALWDDNRVEIFN